MLGVTVPVAAYRLPYLGQMAIRGLECGEKKRGRLTSTKLEDKQTQQASMGAWLGRH